MEVTVFLLLLWTFWGLAAGNTLGLPQFESDWLVLKAQSPTRSERRIPHGLGVVPSMVEVLVRALDGPNKDFIFKGIGNGERDDDNLDLYGSVLYIYNEVSVRVMAPNGLDRTTYGGSIYTGDAPYWRGVNGQHSFFAEIKVRCWSMSTLPTPCFNVSGVPMVAGSAEISDTYKEFHHGLQKYPQLVRVRTRLDGGKDTGWYADAQGASAIIYGFLNRLRITGGLKFSYNNESIRVWTSSVPDPVGSMFCRDDNWGHDLYRTDTIVSRGFVDVVAWCGLYPAFDYRGQIGPSAASEDLQIPIPASLTYGTDFIMDVMVEAKHGPNKGFRFQGIGGAMTNTNNLGEPCSYGGLVYAYNTSMVRIWRPDHSTGAVICISNTMGHGTNSQASQNGAVIIRLFFIGNFGLPEAYQPARLVCSHFTLLGKNSAYNAWPFNVQPNITTSRACNAACQQHVSCVTYAFGSTGCKLFNVTDKSLLYPESDSQVWGLVNRTLTTKDIH